MLPGRLTIEHIEAARARGEDTIFYLDRAWSLEELEELAGIGNKDKRSRRAKAEPVEAAGPEHDDRSKRDEGVAGSRSKPRESRAHTGESS